MNDTEKFKHISEIKVRLRPDDAVLLRALARHRDIPPAVLARTLLLREMRRVSEPMPMAPAVEGRIRG